MKRFIIALALLFLLGGAAGTAQAATGHPFLTSEKRKSEYDNKQIAALTEASLARDSTGNDPIDPAHCKPAKGLHGCATPLHFLVAFQQGDPQAGLTSVTELPAYFRSLKLTTPEDEEYYSACLEDKPGGGYTVFANCVSRMFHKGEKAYMNPKTGKIVLQGDCNNPVGQVNRATVVKPCAFIFVDIPATATGFAFAGLFPTPVTADDRKCLAYKAVGDEEYREVFPDDCPEIACNFESDVAVVGFPVQWRGSVRPRAGRHVFRVPQRYADKVTKGTSVFCITVRLPDGREIHSMALGVRSVHYSVKWEATILESHWQYPPEPQR